MACVNSHTVPLMSCPACGQPIHARIALSFELGDKLEKTVPLNATLTGLHVEHDCIPKQTR